MKCSKVIPHLSLLVDNRLEEPLRGKVWAHVRTCPACQAELADLRSALEFLHSTPPVEPSREFKNAIMAAAGPELARRSARAAKRLRRPIPIWDRPALRWALAPAAALLVLVGTWLYVLMPQAPPGITVASTPNIATTVPEHAMVTATPAEEVKEALQAIADTAPGRTMRRTLASVVGPRRARRPVAPARPVTALVASPAGTASVSDTPSEPTAGSFPATTGQVRPRVTEAGPVADTAKAPSDLIAAKPKSTSARPYRAKTGNDVTSGLAGGLLANEVVLSDAIAEAVTETTLETLTPRGPSYKDLPRIAFTHVKPKRADQPETRGPGYDDLPRLRFPSPAAPKDTGSVGESSTAVPGAEHSSSVV